MVGDVVSELRGLNVPNDAVEAVEARILSIIFGSRHTGDAHDVTGDEVCQEVINFM